MASTCKLPAPSMMKLARSLSNSSGGYPQFPSVFLLHVGPRSILAHGSVDRSSLLFITSDCSEHMNILVVHGACSCS